VSKTTWTELVAQYEILRQRHAELELEFNHVAAARPVSVVAHRQVAGRLAVHRTNLRKWRLEFQNAPPDTRSLVTTTLLVSRGFERL
jgi:hypothetical protein